MAKIKICGIKRKEDIDYVNELKPDYIGFIFVKGRKRYIDKYDAKALTVNLDKNISVVGVFLDDDIEFVKEIIDLNFIDLIQLHGNEDDEYIKELKKYTKKPIINVYRDSIYADYVLVDNIDAGSGKSWSYEAIGDKCFIAGGINIDNIDDVLKLNPYAIDVSSGVETDGLKDYDKMKELIRKVREYEG